MKIVVLIVLILIIIFGILAVSKKKNILEDNDQKNLLTVDNYILIRDSPYADKLSKYIIIRKKNELRFKTKDKSYTLFFLKLETAETDKIEKVKLIGLDGKGIRDKEFTEYIANLISKLILLQGKKATIAYAFDIINKKSPTVEINPKEYEIKVFANKTTVTVLLKRRIHFIPIDSNYEYNITVDIPTKKISPFEDWSYNTRGNTFFTPSKQEKEKIEFVKKHAGIPYKGFDFTIAEKQDNYWVSETNKHSFSKYYIDKITGKKYDVMQGSYSARPLIEGHVLNKDPLKEIFDSTSQDEIIEIITLENEEK